MEKNCSKCHLKKPIEEFQKRTANKDGYTGTCKQCKRQYDNEYYANTMGRKEQIIAGRQRSYKRNQEYVIEYWKTHSCIDCGEDDIVVLDFDHLFNKEYNICELLKGCSLEKLKEEISKCEVVCSNCHRRRTATRGNFWRAGVAYAG